MMINDDEIKKIELLFSQMQIIGNYCAQFYDSNDEYRTGYLIKTPNSIYANVPTGKMNKWHMTLFNKKKENISMEPFIDYSIEHNITRIGFRK